MGGNQTKGDQRSHDGAHGVGGAMQPKGAPQIRGGDTVGEHRAPRPTHATTRTTSTCVQLAAKAITPLSAVSRYPATRNGLRRPVRSL